MPASKSMLIYLTENIKNKHVHTEYMDPLGALLGHWRAQPHPANPLIMSSAIGLVLNWYPSERTKHTQRNLLYIECTIEEWV